MTNTSEPGKSESQIPTYDVVIIGAGISGMYQLHKAREIGLKAIVFEAGGDVGGTWYWNRYPGARFDSESYSYGYSFSKQVLEEWEWSEHFSAQEETLRYLQYVADKFDLRRDIQFNSRVTIVNWVEEACQWRVQLDNGKSASAQFLITAVGPLSVPAEPELEGIEVFRGEVHHSARWPHEAVSFSGKKVGVLGTGATGIQVIQEVAKTAAHLVVFQRTANFAAPLGNRPMTPEDQHYVKTHYDDIFKKCRDSYGSFLHDRIDCSALDVSQREREAFWEKLYNEPGFGIWLGNYNDVLVDPEANRLITNFMVKKIRERVHDPEVAEMLIPTSHGFGSRRVPLETGYYEVFNQDNVELVDVKANPIERLTEAGLRVGGIEYPLDILVLATGFDAITGAFNKIDIRGIGGQTLARKWQNGPQTYLGLQVAGFPNMFMLVGPHNAATFCNIPRCIEQNVDWVTDLLSFMKEHRFRRSETKPEAEREWTEHVYEVADLTLMSKTASWFTGHNPNLKDKPHTFYAYAGGAPLYRQKCDECASNGYEGIAFSE